MKNSESDLDAFKTFNSDDMGEIGIQVKLKGAYKRRHKEKWVPKPGFKSNIAVITLETGISPEVFETLLKSDIDGFVIRAYGAGDMPTRLLPFLKEANKKKIPIVITTQCPNGVTQMNLNLVGMRALSTGLVQVFDMSMESMTTKLRWLLAHDTPYEKIKGMMEDNLCGEIVPQTQEEKPL